ncbi:cytochrome P450 3A24-like [Rhipicephalus sanguineus]|uniref:cytochrome P450 3A24-like n=1 Tax=Rhipicephalus sanguineus TaxID=34632 RepID=UPI0018951108|nr:cytochrome P450 3A24-like [Rhipicephalus sanguineus]
MTFLLGLADGILLGVTALILLYMYAARHRNYWKNQGVTHEKLSLIFGPAKELLSKPVCLIDQERYKKHGRLYGAYEQGKPCLFVAEPRLVKQSLVKDFHLLPNRKYQLPPDTLSNITMFMASADRWRTIRPASSPAFSTGKLRKMNVLIQECARITRKHLESFAEKNDDIDVKRFFGKYSLDVIARCAFGTRIDSHTDATNEFVTQAAKVLSPGLSLKSLIKVLFPGLIKFFSSIIADDEEYEYFRNLCQRIIKERRQNGQRQEDFLQLMMDAQDGSLASSDDGSLELEHKLFHAGSETNVTAPTNRKRLSELEAMAQCVLFFVVGQETTSTTIAVTAYFLALNPDVQEKLRKEVDDCFATNGPEPSLDVISQLKYLNCVVSEALRLFPATARLQRSGDIDYVLGDTGIKLPKGCYLYIPVYAMHHDPELFPDPESFRPQRFSEENVDSIQPYTYLPFGAGPRNCIGMRLALQSVKLCLLHSLHSVEFFRSDKTKVPLTIKKGPGVTSIEEIIVGIRRRPERHD